jgi:hypothetical protein
MRLNEWFHVLKCQYVKACRMCLLMPYRKLYFLWQKNILIMELAVLIRFINIQQRFSCLIFFNSLKMHFQPHLALWRSTLRLLYAVIWVIPRPTHLWRWNRQSVPERWYIKFKCQGITQKKAYNIQNTAKAWNQEHWGYINIYFWY